MSETETSQWYQFGDVRRSDSHGTDLRVPSGAGVERIGAPERQTQPPATDLDDPWLLQLGASTETIAVTVQPRPTETTARIRAGDPETFEIGAVCLADAGGDTAVYHREEPDRHDEQLLLEHVVSDLSAADGATRALDGCFHADTARVADRMGVDTLAAVAKRLGLENSPVVLGDYDLGAEPADWRADWDIDDTPLSGVSDPRMIERDYALLVERYLGDEGESAVSPDLGRCLKAYASAELSLLCALSTDDAVDRLACPRLG